MTAIRETELKKFPIKSVEPMKHSVLGNRYGAAARLIDGMYLPCVVFQGGRNKVDLAMRRFKEVGGKKEYEHIVQFFITRGSQIAGYDIKSVELSPFAWPLGILVTIQG